MKRNVISKRRVKCEASIKGGKKSKYAKKKLLQAKGIYSDSSPFGVVSD